MPPLRSLALLVVLARPVAAQSDTAPPAQVRRPGLAVAEVLAINVIVNRFDAWVLGEWWAKNIGIHSWSRNFKLGWEWDEDHFTTNMFAHPYHGGMYFNAGRSNGLSFWESAPLVFLGSWSWEFFGEAKRPSFNDFFMTTFGGIALGEMFNRVATSVRSNQATGRSRTLREVAALPFDPIGGLNRLARGEWRKQFPNPPEHNPGAYVLRVQAGLRLAEEVSVDSLGGIGALVVDLLYGDQFRRRYAHPFDVFSVRAVLSSASGFNVMRASGRLFAKDISDSGRTLRHIFSINQRFDYVANPAQRIGGQSVEFGIASRWRLGRQFGLRTQVFTDVILLGAIDAPGAGFGERNYDFGPGAGFRMDFAFERRGVRYLTVFGQTELIHALSGASADHSITFAGTELTIPIARGLGVAAHGTYFTRFSRYTDRPNERREYPEARFLLVWTKAGF